MRPGGNSARPVSRNMAFTPFTRSIFESISVPSKSNTNARTVAIFPLGTDTHCNTHAGDSLAGRNPHFSQLLSSRRLEGWPSSKIPTGASMARAEPFRAYRYNADIAAYDRVLTQPYDKITPKRQEEYYATDPHNLIAVEKGRGNAGDTADNNVYTRAAASLRSWIAENVVKQDSVAAFYAYSQEFSVPGSSARRTRRGFIGAGKLEDYSAGVIFRHEHTLSGPKADRLELLRHTRTHTGQLFLLYSDPKLQVDAILDAVEASQAPVTQLIDEYGVTHRLWMIAEQEHVSAIQNAMADQKLVIADGHHRYETSLNFRNESRMRAGKLIPDAPYEFSMMTFVNTRSEGLTILPTHRVVANLR